MRLSLTLAALGGLAVKAAVLDLSADAANVSSILSSTAFDFVVVGGGNAGLAVASRLAAGNTTCNVLVLEAGGSGEGDARIDVPGSAGAALGTQYDWGFSSTPQKKANSRSIYWPRGKVLGGSSAINFLVSTRPAVAEHDVWSNLAGSSAWCWNALQPFYKMAEHFFPPGPNSEGQVPSYIASVHGLTGPIRISYPPYLSKTFLGFFQALRALGKHAAADVHSGNNVGVNYAPSTIDPATHKRSYSIEYLSLAANVVVVLNAQVTKINWQAGASSTVTAQGVSFVPTGGGNVSIALASREVILSAGAVQTPQLLELSGVGDPAVMNPLGIATVVDLAGVGTNLQDHPAVVPVFRLKPGVPSLDQLSDPALLNGALAQYAAGQGILTQALFPLAYLRLGDFLNSTEQGPLSTLGSQANNPQLDSRQFAASQQLYNANVPVMEFLPINVYFGNATAEPGQAYVSLAACLQHSLSRGRIHITSANPLAPPAIDPGYLQSDLDTYLLAKAARYLRGVAQQPQLAQFIDSEAEPGPAVQNEADWEAWVRSVVRTEYHPIGTASMQPRQYGGVVAPNLKVYGTSNVRVVDMSVMPMHVSSHLQTIAYAIAEKAASLILAGQ